MSEFVVQLSNLPTGVDEEQLRAFVRQRAAGATPTRCEIDPALRTARLVFGSESQARGAQNTLNNARFAKKGAQMKAVLLAAVAAAPTLPAAAPQPATVPLPAPSTRMTLHYRPSPAMLATGTDHRSRPPFHFVPVKPALALTDTPVYHDRQDLGKLWTGEVDCTLTTLTPLLAANDQFELKDASDEVRREFARILRQRLQLDHDPAPGTEYAKDKKILTPLCLGCVGREPGPVLIGGAALKGMLRHALGALLSAPMERVQERHFSFRPNVDLKKGDVERLKTKVGVVTERLRDGGLRVRLLNANDLTRVLRPDFEVVSSFFGGEGGWRERLDRLHATTNTAEFSQRLSTLVTTITTAGKQPRPSQRAILLYRYGLDGQGVFNAAFNDRQLAEQRECYCHVGINPTADRGTATLPAGLVAWWRETVEHLGNDQCGHLLRHPDLEDREPQARTALQQLLAEDWRPGDIVYFELAGDLAVTMGHHFRYRWRYRNTIRRTNIREQRADTVPPSAPESLRAVLCPRPSELQSDREGRPAELSGARLLFGYVGTRDGAYQDSEPTTAGIGLRDDGAGKRVRGDFAQLAGRIAFNNGIEQMKQGTTLKERFLNADHECLVPLRPLGSPKPSAVEHYLDQEAVGNRLDNGILCTFGDDDSDATTGDLLGRKFYLHQPIAAQYPERSLYELLADGKRVQHQDDEMLVKNQATIGRFVSKPDRAFRFRVRFVNLRSFELGALLFVLSPCRQDLERLARTWDSAAAPLNRWLDGKEDGNRPLLAHKLGHARPLGLGSVKVEQDALRRLTQDGERLDLRDAKSERDGLIDAFAEWMKNRLGDGLGAWIEGVLVRWLAVHRFAGRECETFEYPRARRDVSATQHASQGPAPDAAANHETIYNYHSNLRTDHARGRKRGPTTPRPQHGLHDIE